MLNKYSGWADFVSKVFAIYANVSICIYSGEMRSDHKWSLKNHVETHSNVRCFSDSCRPVIGSTKMPGLNSGQVILQSKIIVFKLATKNEI
jgi:hypothetical protein